MIALTPEVLSQVVLGYLRRHCRGRAAARTQGRIASDLRAMGVRVAARQVRDVLASLVDHGWPVGTSCRAPAGAFLCQTRADFTAGWRNLRRRFEAQARRLRRFEEMAKRAVSAQQAFDFRDADEQFAELSGAPVPPSRAAENGGGARARSVSAAGESLPEWGR